MAIPILVSLKAAFDLTKDRKAMDENYKNLPKFVSTSLFENIYKKDYIFWGKSKLERFVEEKSDFKSIKEARVYLDALSDDDLKKVTLACADYHLKKNYDKFCKQNQLYSKSEKENVSKFVNHNIGKSVFYSRFSSVGINSFKVGAAIASCSLFFPPAVALFSSVGVSTIGLGIVSAIVVGKFAQRKFSHKLKDLSDENNKSEEGEQLRLLFAKVQNTVVKSDIESFKLPVLVADKVVKTDRNNFSTSIIPDAPQRQIPKTKEKEI